MVRGGNRGILQDAVRNEVARKRFCRIKRGKNANRRLAFPGEAVEDVAGAVDFQTLLDVKGLIGR